MFTRPYFLDYFKRGIDLKTYGHYDDQEHLIVAQAIGDYLVKNNLLKTNKD